jgi:hypothetical protein
MLTIKSIGIEFDTENELIHKIMGFQIGQGPEGKPPMALNRDLITTL